MYAILVLCWLFVLIPYSLIRGQRFAQQAWTWRDFGFSLLLQLALGLIVTLLWFDFFNFWTLVAMCLLTSTVVLIGKREQCQHLLLLLRVYYFTLLMSVIAGSLYELVNGMTLHTLLQAAHPWHWINLSVTVLVLTGLLEFVFSRQINRDALQFFLAKFALIPSTAALFLLLAKALGMTLILSRSHHSLIIAILFLVVMLVEVGFVIVTIFYIAKVYHFSVFKYRHEVLNETYALQVQHLAEIETKSRIVRRLSHDIHNHKIILADLLAREQYTQAQEYVQTLHPAQLTEAGDVPVSEHGIFNALYQQKKARCEQAGIQLTVDIRLPQTVFVSDFDLCVIFGNLFDNAIEAASQCPPQHRWITLRVEIKNANLLIEMENEFIGHVSQAGGRIVSTKGDHVMHGVGLTNIEAVVKQYAGACHYHIEHQRFRVQMRLAQGQ